MMENIDVAIELAHNCVRNNTILEDIHAGEELPEKYKNGFSMISQEEMKELMEQVIANLLYYLDNPELIHVHWDSGLFKAPPEWYKDLERYK